MNCAQRILYNGMNHARTAAILASSVLPVERTVRSLPALKSGSAGLALSGAYSGAADAQFDIEIIDATPTTPIISAPILTGVGNGALSALSFSGAAQSFTLSLVDAGSPELFAAVAFAGTKITARATGAAGNGINITVSRAGLTFTPAAYSLLAPLPKDTRRSDAVGLDFGAAVMAGDDLFPTTAKRLAFGSDTHQIYRQAKQWTGEKWEYVFEPAIQRYIATGERVSEVTGTYTVTVEQGATTETFPSIKTNYDLLLALNTLSALVRIDGVIANDRAADGQAAGELTLDTDAYAQRPIGNGSKTAQNIALESVTVDAAAPTEIVELTCWATTSRDSPNAHLGAELWKVKGSVTGDQGNWKTGDTIAAIGGEWSLKIPSVYPDGYGVPRGAFTVGGIDYMPRGGAEVEPPICVAGMALGPDAVDQTVTLVYTARPSAACACDDMPVDDFTLSGCLMGPNNPTVGTTTMSYPVAIATKMTDLWAWRRDLAQRYSKDMLVTDTTGYAQSGDMFESELKRLADAQLICEMLERTAVKVAASAPALTLWDDAFVDLKSHFKTPLLDPLGTYTAGEAIAAGDWCYVTSGKVYKATAQTAGLVSRPSLVNALCSAAYSSGATIPVANLAIPDLVTGLTGLVAGTAYGISLTTPGTIESQGVPHRNSTATYVGLAVSTTALSTFESASFFDVSVDRFRATCDAVLASAGISPLPPGKSDASIVSDDGCWQDEINENKYWVIEGSSRGAYMPAFNNIPYFSSRKVGSSITASHEFAFQLNIKCPQHLKVGDRITLKIGAAAWPETYQVGDVIQLPIVSAAPLELVGGQNGSADQLWHVNGSVDGAFAPFTATGGSGVYSDGGLNFTLTAGGIAFIKGDAFTFAAEGGHWRWRKDGGAWSGALDIALTPAALSDGVSATFTTGAAPSFTAADLYSFGVRQPNASANVKAPLPNAWRWSTSSATLDVDMGSAKLIDTIAIGLHTLPLGATITVSAGTSQGAADVLAATAIAYHPGTLAHLLADAISARWVRIALASATAGSIGWVWVGQAFTPSLSANYTGRREYLMDRSGGRNVSANLLGSGRGGSLEWTEAAISEVDYTSMVAMLDSVKANGDEPIVFFYNASRPGESVVARIDSDAVEFNDITDYQASEGVERRFQATLPLAAVLR